MTWLVWFLEARLEAKRLSMPELREVGLRGEHDLRLVGWVFAGKGVVLEPGGIGGEGLGARSWSYRGCGSCGLARHGQSDQTEV